ncbi:hypothetical protein Tco_0395797, partial [Tanacetum coccineum]
GPVTMDFSVPKLTFKYLDKQVILRGESQKSEPSIDLEDKVVVSLGGIDSSTELKHSTEDPNETG